MGDATSSRAAWNEALRGAFSEATWPEPPEGFAVVVPARARRVVLRGRVPGAPEPIECALKWHAPRGAGLRRDRAAREGRALEALAGHPVPELMACVPVDGGVLATRWIEGLDPLPAPDALPRATLAEAANLLVPLLRAGLRHRDLHAGNLARDGQGNLMLVDLGRARVEGERTTEALLDTGLLGRLAHGLLPRCRRTQRLRALRCFVAAAGVVDDRARTRALSREVEAARRAHERRFLRGRDRRATRTGRHFVVFEHEGGAGIRRRAGGTQALEGVAAELLAGTPGEAVPLKAGGNVFRVRLEDGQEIVAKRYAPRARGRRPRAVRAFRRLEWLANRGLAAPTPLLAFCARDGTSILLSEWIDAPHLLDAVREAHPDALGGAALHRLGRTVRSLHARALTHRDLKAPNLLWVAETQGPVFPIVDVDGLRRRKRPPAFGRRVRDLGRLLASLPLDEQAVDQIVGGYLAPLPRLPDAAHYPAALGAWVARKRGPAGRPR